MVAGLDFRHNLKRPLFWILVLILALTSYGLSSGHMRISSGDSTVGGMKAWITSEFSIAQVLTLVVFLFYSFFIAVAAGMSIIHDDDLKVGSVLHATPLEPEEYVLGKFLAAAGSFVVLLGIHLLFMAFFNHVMPNAEAAEIRGPFSAGHFVRPAFYLSLPTVFYLTATSFAIGIWARKPILIFFFPVALVLFCGFFLWDWSPSWLDPRINNLLMILDPSGVRWLTETWLKVDRGVEFYNTRPIGFDTTFLLNRLLVIAIGIVSVLAAARHFAHGLKGSAKPGKVRRRREGAVESLPTGFDPAEAGLEPFALGRRGRGRGFLPEMWAVCRAELKELGSQPGLYLFVPIILLQTLGTAALALGPFDTPILATSGLLANRSMNTLTLLVCLLLLFYTVESMEREKSTGLAPIYRATRVRTASVFSGKALANSTVAVVIIVAAFLASAVVLLIQGKVPIKLPPFLLMWALLLVPTYILWTAFVLMIGALTGNRYTTYGIALGALIFTGYRQMTNRMNWVGNWDIWGTTLWTDMGLFEIDRTALLLNRTMALGLAALFIVLTMRLYARQERDASRTGHRLRPGALLRNAVTLLPFAVIPLTAGIGLAIQVHGGFQGKASEKKAKDYWRKNLSTWNEAPVPAIAGADVDLELEPARRWFRTNGSFVFVNHHDFPLRQVPLTGGQHWTDIHWTMNGADYEPEDRLRLYVFTPPKPLAPGDSLRIGFRFEGIFPKGITRNGGGTGEFILPSGVVLTSFTPSFVPVVGFQPEIGVDKENRHDSKEYADDFYEGITLAAFGGGAPYPTRVRITGPSDYRYNSVGTLVEDKVEGRRRVSVWESDHPVNFFNVVAGRWVARQGEGTVIYHHEEHPYNIDEMIEALDASRRYYSEWFMPFPWAELKLSEFPGLAGYAQGFPTNITFSENIGFLTRSDPKANAAFLVTAHEAAHQWWGNILVPGRGPGGDILSEGMSHFSTILLFEQVKGARDRIEFCKRIESRYGDRRQVDSERPLVKIDGTRDGDETVTYDKGGWVFWMLLNEMGRERCLAGLQAFITKYSRGPDYPVLQDFVATLRPFAADSTAYDRFVQQWFLSVVAPEYRLDKARVTAPADTAAIGARWTVDVEVKNAGTGLLPVEVAAVRGERFPAEGKAADYAESRLTVTLGPGEADTVSISCPFEPKQILVDPDARVLQLNRKLAVARL